jgi:DNA-binding MarR family transcriptional regulator
MFIVPCPRGGLAVIVYHLFMNNNSRTRPQVGETPAWYFLTNHAHVLLCVSEDSGIRLRDIAAAVGITERSAHKILSELVEDGYVLRERHGRRNRYKVKSELPLRHPLVREREVGELLEALGSPERHDRGELEPAGANADGGVRSAR